MIDTHVNLHHHLYEEDLEDVLKRAKDNGINGMLTICDRFDNANKIMKIIQERNDFWMSIGAHPHEAKDHLNLKISDLVDFSKNDKVIGIGETGLDFHYDLSPREQQVSVFETHIYASQETQLPLIVHTREADDTMAEILIKAMNEKEFPLLMHCYTSSENLLKKMVEINAFVSISGIATFKNANDVRNNIKFIPKNRLLVETDCPYLSPIPKRGTRNEPAFIIHLVEFLCQFLNEEKGDLIKRLDDNFYTLFKKAK